jgi:hypothetical protein
VTTLLVYGKGDWWVHPFVNPGRTNIARCGETVSPYSKTKLRGVADGSGGILWPRVQVLDSRGLGLDLEAQA